MVIEVPFSFNKVSLDLTIDVIYIAAQCQILVYLARPSPTSNTSQAHTNEVPSSAISASPENAVTRYMYVASNIFYLQLERQT